MKRLSDDVHDVWHSLRMAQPNAVCDPRSYVQGRSRRWCCELQVSYDLTEWTIYRQINSMVTSGDLCLEDLTKSNVLWSEMTSIAIMAPTLWWDCMEGRRWLEAVREPAWKLDAATKQGGPGCRIIWVSWLISRLPLLKNYSVHSLDEYVSCRHKSLRDVPAVYATRWQIGDARAYGVAMTVYRLQRGANLMRFNCKSSCLTLRDDGKRASQMSYQIKMRWNVTEMMWRWFFDASYDRRSTSHTRYLFKRRRCLTSIFFLFSTRVTKLLMLTSWGWISCCC